MVSTELHIVIRQLLNNQGKEFLKEKRFLNILSDMDCFADCPTCKKVFISIIENNHLEKIISYANGFESKTITFNSIFENLSKLYNYSTSEISFCLQNILYGLNIIDKVECYSIDLDYSWILELNEYTKIQNQDTNPWNSEFLIVELDPKHADLIIDDKKITHDDGEIVVDVACGTHQIKATAPKYHSYENVITIVEDQQNIISIKLKPKFGSIMLMTNALNSAVYIDNKEIGTAPISIKELESGYHTLKITAPLHKNYEEIFSINDGEKIQKTIQLEPNYGDVRLESNDKDLQIFIDGKYAGKSCWNGRLITGEHVIECRKESHFSKSITVFVNKGENVINHFILPELDAYYGCLKVNVRPIGSTVLLDNKIIGKTPLKYKNALTGIHRIKVYHELCDDTLEKEITIKDGQITTVEETLPQTFSNKYEDIQIGCYFYSDGTFSEKYSEKKNAVGIVFSLETTEEQKKQGWTHGQIFSLGNCASGANVAWNNAKKYAPEYKFKSTKISDWELPSIQQWQMALKNLVGINKDQFLTSNDSMKLKIKLNITIDGSPTFWAGPDPGILMFSALKNRIEVFPFVSRYDVSAKVRAVAAF